MSRADSLGSFAGNVTAEKISLSNIKLTPSSAPSSPTQGDMYLDSSDNNLKIYTGNLWKDIVNASPSILVELLIVAGAGGGGCNYHTVATGGGGGAGGYRAFSSETLISGTTYRVAVGSGGAGGPNINTNGTKGNDSIFHNYTSAGGGYGATNQRNGGDGGSGGGASGPNGTSPSSYAGGIGNTPSTTPVQGYNGGSAGRYQGGFGGGSGGAANGNQSPGPGTSSSITGTPVTRATGGSGTSTAGGNNTGDGGSLGGGGANNPGFQGGSGIVIISYPDTYPDLTSIDVSHTCRGATTVSGTTTPPSPSTSRTGYKTYEFLDGDGNISW
jgi:hypothetical protein